jgi:NhaA family Na+:H+ antiporter
MLCSIAIANSPYGEAFASFRHQKIGWDWGMLHLRYSIEHWVNDGLMAIFFLLIGLEIERELYVGELSDRKNASLPLIAALGGMLIPALLHWLLNRGTPTQNGFGIPMATDIAFALGVLSLLGKRIPPALKVFLTALAIVDDLGAIVVIALFYNKGFAPIYFGLALAVWGVLLLFNRLGYKHLALYLVPGVLMWYFMLQSGIHATIAGVLLAFAVPFDKNEAASPSHLLEDVLGEPVAFIIMPIFALINTGVVFQPGWLASLQSPNSLGILAGLGLGKVTGIVGASWLAVRLKLAQLPNGVRWQQMLGLGFLAGIGFTMAIFVTLLAFDDPATVQTTKIAILCGSLLSGLIGYLLLRAQSSVLLGAEDEYSA